MSFYQKADVSGLNPPWTQRLSNCKSFAHPRVWNLYDHCIWSIGVSHNDAWYLITVKPTDFYWEVMRVDTGIFVETFRWKNMNMWAASCLPKRELTGTILPRSCTALKKSGSLNDGRCYLCYLLKGVPNSCLVGENSEWWVLAVFVHWKESFMLL